MQGVRVLFRRTQVARRCCASVTTIRRPSLAASTRMFSAVPNPEIDDIPSMVGDCDFVRDAIKKLTQKDDADVKRPPVTDDELNKRLQQFQSLVKEAHLCIADCEDCASADIRDEESKAAAMAVEEAFSAYIDLLDDFRRANEEQLKRFNDERMQSAAVIKHLRMELHNVDSCST